MIDGFRSTFCRVHASERLGCGGSRLCAYYDGSAADARGSQRELFYVCACALDIARSCRLFGDALHVACSVGDGARRDAHVCGSRGLPGFYGAACSAVGRAAHGTWFVARGVSYCCCDHSFRGAYLPAFGCSGQCAGGHSRAASSCGCRGLSDISGPTGRRKFLGASLNLSGRASSASRFFS